MDRLEETSERARSLVKSVEKHVNVPIMLGAAGLAVVAGAPLLAVVSSALLWGSGAKLVSNIFSRRRGANENGTRPRTDDTDAA